MQETDNGSSDEEVYEMSRITETTRLVSRELRGWSHSMPSKSSAAASTTAASSINRGYNPGKDETNFEKIESSVLSKDDEAKLDNFTNSRTKQKATVYVWLLAFFAAIGGFLFGYDTGVVSGAMLLLTDEFSLSKVLQEVIVSVTIGAAFVSAIIGGYISDRFGRKACTILASLVFTAGALVLGFAENVTMLIVGRLILGTGIGVASMTVPVYIAEVAPAHIRGQLLTVNTLFITGGQFVASVLDGAFSYLKPNGWRYMLGLAGVPSLIQLIGFLFLPESPRWLMKKDEARAHKVLVAVRGTEDVQEELAEMRQVCEKEKAESSSSPTILLMLKSPSMRRALIIGCGLQFFQQVSGINTVMYYSASIIKMAGVHDPHTAIWLAAMTAGINFVFTLIGVWLVERIGRKRLLLFSLGGVILSLALLAVGFQIVAYNSPSIVTHEHMPINVSCTLYSSCESCIEDKSCGFCFVDVNGEAANGSCLPVSNDHNDVHSKYGRCSANANRTGTGLAWAEDFCPTSYSWLPIFGLALYLMFFAPGMGPMPWTINAEIYPLWARSTGNSMSAATNWISNLVVSMTFLTLTETITKYGTYWLYVSIASVGFGFFLCLLPETKGCRLEDVEELFVEPWCTPCCLPTNQKTKAQIEQKASSAHL